MSKRIKLELPKLGIRNADVAEAMPKGSVLDAVNVDIGDSGSVRRRAGAQVFLTLNGIHTAFWSHVHRRIYYQNGESLGYVSADNELVTLIPHGMPRCTFVEYNGEVIVSGGSSVIAIREDATIHQALASPTEYLHLQYYHIRGSLGVGQYTLTMSLKHTSGEESGCIRTQTIILNAADSLKIIVPTLTIPDHTYSVYMTDADGQTFHHLLDSTGGTHIIIAPAAGRTLDSYGVTPMNSGVFTEWVGGRLFTASRGQIGNRWTLYWSEPLRPLYTQCDNFIQFYGEAPRFLARSGQWLFIGDSRGVWRIDGSNPNDTELHNVSKLPPIINSGLSLPASALPLPDLSNNTEFCAVWLTTEGAVAGLPDGSVKQLHSHLSLDGATIVTNAAYVLNDGIAQLLFVTDRDSLP